MSHWTSFFTYFQVFYLFVVISTLICFTLVYFFENVDMNEDELYEEYVLAQIELYEVLPTKREVTALSWLFRAVIFAVLPAAALIYRGRLLSMTVFMRVKMHQGSRKGLAYSKSIELLNYFFIGSKLRRLNYIQYITFRQKHKHSYERLGEYAVAFIMVIIVWFRFWNTKIDPFMLPWEYLMLIGMLLFQKQACFLIKIIVFIPVAIIFPIINCVKRCNSNGNDLNNSN